ncbi:MAG: Plug domain-containing protein, partial [Aquabacterium sp.]|nr:Plug domain-containing protein [Aquabacterium sp.]
MNTHHPSPIRRIAAAAFAACGALWLHPASHAQTAAVAADSRGDAPKGELQTVTVTAERKAKSIQKTSIALEAVSGTDIAEQGLSSGAEILKNVANVEIQGAARGSMIAIRGIGSDLPPGMGESAVSTNYDGIYNFRAEMTTLGLF